jgi:hypothetical protein
MDQMIGSKVKKMYHERERESSRRSSLRYLFLFREKLSPIRRQCLRHVLELLYFLLSQVCDDLFQSHQVLIADYFVLDIAG